MENLNTLLETIKNDIAANNPLGLLETLMQIDADEVGIFFQHSLEMSKIIEKLPTLQAVAALYEEMAPIVKRAITEGILKKYEDGEKSFLIVVLDAVSLVHVASFAPECTGYAYSHFVIRNSKIFAFWRWFRSYLPADGRILGMQKFEFHPAFVLPKILISNPHDLRFYKELCIELEALNPELYAELSIEPEIVEAIVAKAIALEAGEDVPRRAVPMSSVKNNFFIADYLR